MYSRLLSPTMRQQQWILQECCDYSTTAVISWCVLRLRLWSRAVNIGHGGLSQIIWVCCISGNISLPSLPADMLCAFRPILYPVVSYYNYHLRRCIYSLVPDLLIGVSNFQQKQGLIPPGKCSSRDNDFNYFVENVSLRIRILQITAIWWPITLTSTCIRNGEKVRVDRSFSTKEKIQINVKVKIPLENINTSINVIKNFICLFLGWNCIDCR